MFVATWQPRIISTSGEPLVNRLDLPALTLVGPTRHKLVLDPLAIHLLENRLYIITLLWMLDLQCPNKRSKLIPFLRKEILRIALKNSYEKLFPLNFCYSDPGYAGLVLLAHKSTKDIEKLHQKTTQITLAWKGMHIFDTW